MIECLSFYYVIDKGFRLVRFGCMEFVLVLAGLLYLQGVWGDALAQDFVVRPEGLGGEG